MTELFPMIDQPEQDEMALPLCRETAWDFANAKPIFQSGVPTTVTGAQAVRVWCWKALKTPRTRHEIYSWDFGSELESLIGQNYSDELKQAEAVRYVREALEISPYVTGVENIKVSFADGRLTIDADVKTIYGEVTVNVR